MPGVTKEQILAAREADLFTYLQFHEPGVLKQDGPNFRHKEHDSLVYVTGKRYWYWNSRGRSINALDYLIQIRGYGLVDAVHALVGGEIPQEPAYRSTAEIQVSKEPEKKTFALPWARRCATAAVFYLQKRGISSEVIRQCLQAGIFYEARYHGEPVCVFVGKDDSGKAKFACMRSISGNLKKDVYGSDKGYNFCYPPQSPGSRHVAVFEAPIDALSHATLQELEGWKWNGFAIEVKSADGSYCETFTTPKSGVIEVKGLRVGIYTVTEVANRASKDYIIPDAATVEIKADQTSTVQFFNEKPEKPDNPKNPEKPSVPSNPSTPQKPVPQTGDDPYIFLYGGLLAAVLIGGSVFAVYYFKKGKYSRTSPKRTAVGVSVLSLCVLVALGSGFLVFRDLNQYAESKDAYRDLAGYVEVPEQTASPESAPDPTEPKRDDADIVLPSVDFETLRENGPDIIGWLSLPDTVLNYPVTHTDNNEYYLNHLYDGTYNKVGCLFADYENRADFSDRNTIIYGHNMRDGSMFALLNRYDEQSYFDTHRQMYLVTPKGGYVMEIFTAFAAKPEESGSKTSPWQLSWKDDGAYTTWLTAMKERSAVESDVTVTCSDKVLTLSTCTPGGTGRFLVMGKLVKVDNEI